MSRHSKRSIPKGPRTKENKLHKTSTAHTKEQTVLNLQTTNNTATDHSLTTLNKQSRPQPVSMTPRHCAYEGHKRLATTDGMRSTQLDEPPPSGTTHVQKMGILVKTPPPGMTHAQKMGITATMSRKSWNDAQSKRLRGAIRITSASPSAIRTSAPTRSSRPKKGVEHTSADRLHAISRVGTISQYIGQASCMIRTATGNQKGILNPPTSPVREPSLHKNHTIMGDVEQVAFIALPPALSFQGPLGPPYTTENASKATQAKDAERPPDTHRGLYHGPAVKVGYPLALPGPQDQEQQQDQQENQDQDRGRAGNTELVTVNTVAGFAADKKLLNTQDQKENRNNLRGEAPRHGF